MGEAPPYEAFCMGGSNSIRGWYDCDMAVSKAFSELTIEYRFPLISIFSGEVFMDAGTDFGTSLIRSSPVSGTAGGKSLWTSSCAVARERRFLKKEEKAKI